MTQEEKIEIIKALAQDANKMEIVLEKNVEYEIGNVESGGIAVQNVYNYPAGQQPAPDPPQAPAAPPQAPAAAQPSQAPAAAQPSQAPAAAQPQAPVAQPQAPAAQPPQAAQPQAPAAEALQAPAARHPRKLRSSSLNPRVVDDVFAYRFLDYDGGHVRLVQLFQKLLRAEWIHPSTKPDDFIAIFEGEPKAVKVKWMAPQSHLYYLVKTLDARQLIRLGQGSSIWVVTGSHFLDSDSRPFDSWNKQKTPLKAKATIDRMADLLDPTKDEWRNA